MTDIPTPVSLSAWLICLACLSPAVWRIVTQRARYLDPIWGLVFMLALNRLSFLTMQSKLASHATAVILALILAAMTLSYQRADK